QIGASQYDFETAVVHELGHALGLGHSSTTTSVMYPTLTTGTAERTLAVADLAIPDAAAGADALHAAGFPVGAAAVSPAAAEGAVRTLRQVAGSFLDAGRAVVFAASPTDQRIGGNGSVVVGMPTAAPARALAAVSVAEVPGQAFATPASAGEHLSAFL